MNWKKIIQQQLYDMEYALWEESILPSDFQTSHPWDVINTIYKKLGEWLE